MRSARSPSARYRKLVGAFGATPARSPSARYGGIVALLLIASAASGCFLNEIDKSVNANKSKAQAVAGTAKQADDAAPKQVASAKDAKAAAPAGPSWWQTATTLGSEESNLDAVACKLGGRTEFMTRDDCLSRGGSAE